MKCPIKCLLYRQSLLLHFCRQERWMPIWSWNSCVAMVYLRASGSVAKGFPTVSSSMNSVSGELRRHITHNPLWKPLLWCSRCGCLVRWYSDMYYDSHWFCLTASILQLWDPGCECHPQGVHGRETGLHTHGEFPLTTKHPSLFQCVTYLALWYDCSLKSYRTEHHIE